MAVLVDSGKLFKACDSGSGCLKYLSPYEYFVYCCCKNGYYKDCAYTSDTITLQNIYLNYERFVKYTQNEEFYDNSSLTEINKTIFHVNPLNYENFIHGQSINGMF